MKKLSLILILFVALGSCLRSQSAFVSSSSVNTSASGTVEFTVGQMSGETISSANGFVCNGVNVPLDYQTIPLIQGKNFIAKSVFLTDESFPNLFGQQITDYNLERLEDNQGNFLIPSFSVSSLGSWNSNQSYIFYSHGTSSISLSGPRIIPSRHPIALRAGWNLVPFVGNTRINAQTAFSSISGSLIIVMNSAGQAYVPATGENTLEQDTGNSGYLLPGNGYAVFVGNDCILNFPIE